MSFYVITRQVRYKGDADVWSEAPTLTGTIMYSVITPILCCCGIFGNTVSLLILRRKELMGSAYTYLAVLACVDLGMSIILLLGGISRGIMWSYGWVTYDSLFGLPLSGVMVILGVLAITCLTLDRVIYLWNPLQCSKPKFCNSWVARRLMIGSFAFAVIFSLPYCFIYDWNDDGTLTTTAFFDSIWYKAFNWFTLFAFAVIPAIVLLLGNSFLILSLRKAKMNRNNCRTSKCKRRDHTNLTITLVMIIIFFLITNVPESLASRTAAINLLFQGDHERANTTTLEGFRQVCTILKAVDVNTNFVFYYTFCPAFCKTLRTVCRCVKRRPSSNLQVNVFVLNGSKANEIAGTLKDKQLSVKVHKTLEISKRSIETAFDFNIADCCLEKAKNGCSLNENGDYMKMETDFAPPFSTVLEESSCTTNCKEAGKE
ncbi:probable G-protein coupled receptor frpr-1 [Dendroctonus ponderosae]|nr:probable G-protein coupled receptor frpr-1 [Dendroctonus ponderosae]KAH1014749.1 hypothetical protein HUJ05_012581 [Dendroctonus ponderosae]